MCDLCDPDRPSMDEHLEQVRGLLGTQRFAVQAVSGSTSESEFSYTVGLTAHGLHELIVLGLRQREAMAILHCWGEYRLDDDVVLPGETLESGPFLLEAVEVERPEDHLVVATALFGPSVRALQLAWADSRGRWPWEAGHRGRRAGQPVLGVPTPHYCQDHRPDRLDLPPHP